MAPAPPRTPTPRADLFHKMVGAVLDRFLHHRERIGAAVGEMEEGVFPSAAVGATAAMLVAGEVAGAAVATITLVSHSAVETLEASFDNMPGIGK